MAGVAVDGEAECPVRVAGADTCGWAGVVEVTVSEALVLAREPAMLLMTTE